MIAEPKNPRSRYLAMMTNRQRTVGLVLVLGSVCTLLPLVAQPKEPREVPLVVQGMAFYLGEDRTSPNPTIRVAPGERIRLTLVNKDPGFEHNFVVDAWRLRASTRRGDERASVIFEAPDQPGTTEYVCTRHAAMMRGTIEVAAGREAMIARY